MTLVQGHLTTVHHRDRNTCFRPQKSIICLELQLKHTLSHGVALTL